jgi:hypothetical protein
MIAGGRPSAKACRLPLASSTRHSWQRSQAPDRDRRSTEARGGAFDVAGRARDGARTACGAPRNDAERAAGGFRVHEIAEV